MVDLPDQKVLLAQQPLVLAQQRLLFLQHLRLGVLPPLGANGHGQRVGKRLQEGDVGIAEFAAMRAVDLEHAEGVAVCPDQHVDGTADAVLEQQLRRAKPRLCRQVVGNHRFPGTEGVSCRALEIAAHARVADHPRLPAYARAYEKRLLLGQVLQHFREPHLQAIGRHAARLIEDRLQVVGFQGKAPVGCHQFLLTQAEP